MEPDTSASDQPGTFADRVADKVAGLPFAAKAGLVAVAVVVVAVVGWTQTSSPDPAVTAPTPPPAPTGAPESPTEPSEGPAAPEPSGHDSDAHSHAEAAAGSAEGQAGDDPAVGPDGEPIYELPDGFPNHLLATFAPTLLDAPADRSWPEQWDRVRHLLTDRYWAELQDDFETNAARYEAWRDDAVARDVHSTAENLQVVADFEPDGPGRPRVVHAYRVTTTDPDGSFTFDRTLITTWEQVDGEWLIDHVEFPVPD